MRSLTTLTFLFMISCANSDTITTTESSCDIRVEQTFLTDSIINELKMELFDPEIMKNFSALIDLSLISLESSKLDSHILFPYQDIDSVIYSTYEPYNESDMNIELKSRKRKARTKLCEKKIKAIINMFNNPNYFMYGECGTPIPEADLEFYHLNKRIARIEFACDLRQTICEPYNKLNKFGGLNKKGLKILHEIAPWK